MNLTRPKKIERVYIGKDIDEVMELPDLIDIQLSSYERFLQRETLKNGQPLKKQGLQEVFLETFPIVSQNEELTLSFDHYILEESNVKFSENQCKKKGLTYSIPLKARVSLFFSSSGEMRQKDIYMGEIPIMTDRGTFIVNGAERVVVSQIHRSPGVVFSREKGIFASRIIPNKGSWLEFEIDQKKELIYAKIDRKKRILATLLLRALGLGKREEIVAWFYETKTVSIDTPEAKDKLKGSYLAKDVWLGEGADRKKLYRAGDILHEHEIAQILSDGIREITIIDESRAKAKEEGCNYLASHIILNCFEREDAKYIRDDKTNDEPTKEDALSAVYSVLQPGEPVSVENAEKDLAMMFFNSRRYDLGKVGRYKLNRKFSYTQPAEESVLTMRDVVNTMLHLIKVYNDDANIDDIDHLGNRRVRSVGELLANAMKTAFTRMERIAKERMTLKEIETIKPSDLISIKPVVAAIKEFFGSSQLSQFMDQVNPLAELTHKRRLNALGPGGLSRDRAGFEVRDVHYTHYGRMCPIETPEGPNIGLIVSLASYSRVNDYGFLETPYRKVAHGKATRDIEYLSAIDEEKYYIAQAGARVNAEGVFQEDLVSCRKAGDYTSKDPATIQYMDVSPKQIISVSSALIPFLEHDDANRALMGSNMQRQAVPLLFPDPPIVGTGMERKAAYDSGVLVKAKRGGEVVYVSSTCVRIRPEGASDPSLVDEYELTKFARTNQDTCFNHRPVVREGDVVARGTVLADGPATLDGELALGRNLLLGFVPWNGYNYEDAILISERVVKEDIFTSIHIKEFSTEIRETKLGPERITRDVPNCSEKSLEDLDEEGVVRIGAKVKAGSILVGKVTPKSETETTPEYKLLNSIFGEKAKDVKDSSLRLPHGIEGTVIDIQRLRRNEGDDLAPGVDEVVKVLVAKKRKLREGDKMAGRHGNKGVVARVLPVEDMPFMEDGTALDICLNPLGVPSRMNLGQILESELGMAGYLLGENYSTPVFQSASADMIETKLESAGFSHTSKTTLIDGRTGVPFVNPVMVGVMYVLKLHHLVDDKMHARSTGPYSLVTQQPLGGKAQFGGQRLGEMEVWALEAYGAANTLQELLTIKSDDMTGRAKIYEAIVKGEATSAAGIPESFNVLVQELRGLALDMSIFDAKERQIPLTEKDEELIAKQGNSF
ncbi:MAG: DNA-directed RNA polymerase subunit beta [Spirochaetales bacterium]|nr:DNA-directed RNA polymerase subunit beta [Spirochaetales bacterium]